MEKEMIDYLMKTYVNTEISQTLYDMLYSIWADYNFAFGVIIDLKSDEKKLQMINLLKKGLKNTDAIELYTMAIERDISVDEMKEIFKTTDWSKYQELKENVNNEEIKKRGLEKTGRTLQKTIDEIINLKTDF